MAYGNENIQNQGLTSEGNQSDNTNTQSTSPLHSGSNQNFPLSKTIISNQRAKDILAGTFNEVIISEEKFDSTKIQGIYNDLFYQIPKKGKKSHYSIIEQSTDYVYPEINENLENDIDALSANYSELNKLFTSASIPNLIPQHPIYENGLLLQLGTNGDAPDDLNSDIWYMQQGLKRKIGRNSQGHVGGYWLRLVRQTNYDVPYESDGTTYIPNNTSPLFRYLTAEELNQIPNGDDINQGSDLNINPVNELEPTYIFSEIELELTCKGVESFYKFGFGDEGYDYDLSGYPNTGGYWWLDGEGSCKVTVVTDNDPSFNFTTKTQNLTWKGTRKVIISRDAKFYGHTLNGTSDPLNPDFYRPSAEKTKEKETRQGYGMNLPPLWKWKRWGEGNIFPAITYVKPGSRISYRIKKPTTYNQDGNVRGIDGGGSHWLNATIDGEGPLGSAQQQGYPEQENLFSKGIELLSNEGTRMIKCTSSGPLADKCFGMLGQNSRLLELFSNPSCPYYKTKTGQHNVYGQPILKVKGRYAVFLQRWREHPWGVPVDWQSFYYIDDGGVTHIKNKNLDDNVQGYKRYSKSFFTWSNEDSYISGIGFDGTAYINNPTIYFPGLQGVTLNTRGADKEGLDMNQGNPFNPKNGGSNFEEYNLLLIRLKRG